MTPSSRIAAAVARGWTRIYTSGLAVDERESRRAEIESDLWELQHDAIGRGGHGRHAAVEIVARLFLGIPDDLHWRVEQMACGVSAAWLRPAFLVIALSLAFTLAISAATVVDLPSAVKVERVVTGWTVSDRDDGTLVPAFSFVLSNTSDHALPSIEVNAVFHRDAEQGNSLGARYAVAAGGHGLVASQSTRRLLLRAPASHRTSSVRVGGAIPVEPTSVTLFAKSGSPRWIRLGTYAITPGTIEP